MRDERIAGTWRDIPNLHKNAVKEKRYVLVGIALIFVGYALLVVTVIMLPRAAALIGDEVKQMLRMVVKGMYGAG